MLGMGAMLHYLGGGSKKSASEYVGRTIVSAKLEDNRLKLKFSDGDKIDIWDDGQSCCESRYMTTDDNVSDLVGYKLTKIEAKNGPDMPEDYGNHETVFVEVGTDQGCITLVNHNEHNGYYGGFGLTITEDKTP